MKNLIGDTIVAPATVPGTGAISIVRISGPDCFRCADAVVQLNHGSISECAGYTIHYGEVPGLDDVLVSVFKAPHSYTGEDSVEISCHASRYIAEELVRRLLEAGCRMALPGEFTRRAFLNGKMDLAQAEAVADLISSTTAASHRVAYNQLRGGFSTELAVLRSELVEMTSLLELELDFSEEEVEFADRSRLLALIDKTRTHVVSLADTFKFGNAIRNGVPVAIVGATNVGKSTLLNALVGEDRALVSDIAGTTRDTVEEVINLNGIPFRFIDTAGIRETDETVEQMGIERTFRKISEAEIVIGMVDVTAQDSTIKSNLELMVSKIDFETQKFVLCLNKVDLGPEKDVNKNVNMINDFVTSLDKEAVVVKLAAKKGLGLSELRDTLSDLESHLIPNADSTFVTNIRHYESLRQTADSLAAARFALTSGTPSDLVAEDLRRAISSLNQILGTDLIDPESVLQNIFRN
ncbi:MAG: tRNA uridine-5-carboxymethylaminomethyl(34) synthesis GTPase MnmE, partial [Lachnospiraceae bacterium]|nr:tRNA uridine-5-carboxymethylaminomethyl(34) synthesis GTPase MnmE [Lachnospiraceae bacterium]